MRNNNVKQKNGFKMKVGEFKPIDGSIIPDKNIKFIATTKEWHDKVNGNTYFSTRIEDIENDKVYILPFQYGYGSQSEYETKKVLQLCVDKLVSYHDIEFKKLTNCLKKEVEEHGKGSLSNRYNFLNSGGFSFYYQD